MSGTDYTQTANLQLYKPIKDAAIGTWGDLINTNADTLDALLASSAAGPFLPLAGGQMSGGLNVTATGGSAVRSVQDRFGEVADVRDFYSGNWDTAFDAAFNSLPATGGVVWVPPGDYAWNAAHVWANKPVALIGAGKGITRIAVNHTGVGLTINQIGANAIFNRTKIEGFTFYAGAAAGPTQGVIAVNYPSGASWPTSYQGATFTASHVEMQSNSGTTGPTWANTFRTGFTLTGCWQAKLLDIHFFGAPTNPGLSGSYALGLAECEDTRIVQLFAQYGQAAVTILDHGEGIDLVGASIVGCDWGINVGPSATNWPNPSYLLFNLIQVVDCECNTYLGAFSLRNVQNTIATSNHFSRFADSGASRWIFANLTDCNWSVITDNRLEPGGATGSTNTYVSLTATASWGAFNNIFRDSVMDTSAPGMVWAVFSGSPDPSLYNTVEAVISSGVRRIAGPGLNIANTAGTTLLTLATNGVLTTPTGVLQPTGGVSFGTNTGASDTDFTKHIALNTTAGAGINYATGGHVAIATQSGGSVAFYQGTTSIGFMNSTGLNMPVGGAAAAAGAFTTLAASGVMSPIGGLSFGTNTGASATDLSKGIIMNTNGPSGINFYSGGINMRVEAGSAVAWYQGTTNMGYLNNNGLVSVGGLGVHGTAASATKPTVTGAKGSNAALASLLTALVGYGLVNDSTTA
jgi:hypothetical protein